MKLLLDENLSPRLAAELAGEYPETAHVRDRGLRGADDRAIWDHARHAGFVIVSKDSDFRERSYIEGAPPKVVWLDVGNAGTDAIAALLRVRQQAVTTFAESAEASLLILSLGSPAV